MSTFEQQLSLKHEQTDAVDNFGTPIKKFCCSLCGFGFSKEEYLVNHFKLCKDVENPAERLGAGSTAIKSEPRDEEIRDTELFDEPTNDIKYEELEISETSISERPKTEIPQQPSKTDRTTRVTKLKKHSKTPREKLFKCEICDYAATTKSNLGMHIKAHTKEKRFKCGKCNYSGPHRTNLTVHMWSRHTESDKSIFNKN